jgi:hypothetical protein
MTTSSDDFSTIIGEASIGSPARERLARVFSEASEKHKALTLPHLVELAQRETPISVEKLVLALTVLVKHGLAKRIVQVESPGGGGIGNFKSIQEVPDEIYDERQDRWISVEPDNVVVVYKF